MNRFFIFFVTFFSLWVHAEYDPTDDMLAAFGQNCSMYGELTSKALTQTEALKGVLKSIRDDSDCKGIASALDSLNASINPDLFLTSNLHEKIYEQNKSVASELELALNQELSLGSAGDPNYILALQTELATRRIELHDQRRQPYLDRYAGKLETIKSFQLYSVQLFEALKSSSKCTSKYPNLVAQIGAQVLGLSSGFSSSGLVGTAMLATGVALDHFFEFLRDYGIQRSVNKLVRTRKTIALGCMLEGLARTWCEARDLQKVIRTNKSMNSDINLAPEWSGVDLVARDLISFQRWAVQLTAGSQASSVAQAQEKKEGADLENAAKKMTYDLQAVVATAKLTLASDVDKKINRKSLLQETYASLDNVIQRFVRTVSWEGGSEIITKGPLYSLFIEDVHCGPLVYLYSAGQERKCSVPIRDGESCLLTCIASSPYALPTTNDDKAIEDINSRFASLDSTVRNLLGLSALEVARKVALVKENNSQLVLAETMTQSENNRTTVDFFKNAKKYLERVIQEEPDLYQIPLKGTVDKALRRVSAALERIQNPSESPDSDLLELASILTPKGDAFDLSREISLIVKQDIDHRLRMHKLDRALSAIMLLSNSDGLGQLLRNYVGFDAADAQAAAAQSIAHESLDIAGEFFKEDLIEILKDLETKAKTNSHNARQVLALACMRTLLIPSFNRWEEKEDVLSICKNRSYYSVHDTAKLELNFNSLHNRFMEYRVCSVYDFFRKSRMYEIRPWQKK
ncbi:MAG: hypothetical protein AB7F43_09050 [Bacteriovoracia bacterium]